MQGGAEPGGGAVMKNDGGYAFPHKAQRRDGTATWWHTEHGMSLRDYFAAKAMQGDWAAQDENSGFFVDDTPDQFLEARAKLYYRMADATLKARES